MQTEAFKCHLRWNSAGPQPGEHAKWNTLNWCHPDCAYLPASKAPGAMVCREWQVCCPPSPPDSWLSLDSSVHGVCRILQPELLFFFSRWGVKPLAWVTSQRSFSYRKVTPGHRNLNDQIYTSPSAKGKNRAQLLASRATPQERCCQCSVDLSQGSMDWHQEPEKPWGVIKMV